MPQAHGEPPPLGPHLAALKHTWALFHDLFVVSDSSSLLPLIAWLQLTSPSTVALHLSQLLHHPGKSCVPVSALPRAT